MGIFNIGADMGAFSNNLNNNLQNRRYWNQANQQLLVDTAARIGQQIEEDKREQLEKRKLAMEKAKLNAEQANARKLEEADLERAIMLMNGETDPKTKRMYWEKADALSQKLTGKSIPMPGAKFNPVPSTPVVEPSVESEVKKATGWNPLMLKDTGSWKGITEEKWNENTRNLSEGDVANMQNDFLQQYNESEDKKEAEEIAKVEKHKKDLAEFAKQLEEENKKFDKLVQFYDNFNSVESEFNDLSERERDKMKDYKGYSVKNGKLVKPKDPRK